jgi:hypothetical protein
VLVNLTGRAGEEEGAMAPPDCDGLSLWAKVKVRNLADRNARDVLAGITSGALARCLLA